MWKLSYGHCIDHELEIQQIILNFGRWSDHALIISIWLQLTFFSRISLRHLKLHSSASIN